MKNYLSESISTNIDVFLTQINIQNPDQCKQRLNKLKGICKDEKSFIEWIPRLLENISNYDEMDILIERFSSIILKNGDPQNILNYLMSDNDYLQKVLLICISEYLYNIIATYPQVLDILDINESLYQNQLKYFESLDKFIVSSSSRSSGKDLFFIKNYIHFIIGYQELNGIIDISESRYLLSKLADTLIERIFTEELSIHRKKYNNLDGITYSVIAVEDYAQRNLSYNSLLKVVFIYSLNSDLDSQKGISVYQSIKSLYIKIIDRIFPEKQQPLYQIKYPTSTETSKIPIIFNIETFLQYLEERNLISDRINLRYSRLISGDQSLYDNFKKSIFPYTYRKYLSQSDISRVKHYVTRVYQHIDKDPLKIIHLFHQLFYLFHENIQSEKTNQDILTNLSSIKEINLITEDEYVGLTNAYRYFSKIQHLKDLQIHDESNLQIFKDMYGGISEKQELQRSLLQANQLKYSTNEIYVLLIQKIFGNHFKELINSNYKHDFLALLEQSTDEAIEILSQYYIQNPFQILSVLKNLAPVSQKARDGYNKTMSNLFTALEPLQEIDSYIIRFANTIHKYNAKETIFEILYQNEEIVNTFTHLFSNAPYISDILNFYPELIERLFEKGYLKDRTTVKSIRKRFKNISQYKSFTDSIFLFKYYELFRIALRKLFGIIDIYSINIELSYVADVILLETFKYFFNELSSKKGYPTSDYAIIILGKLGGRETGLSSDLDIVFLFENEDDNNISYNNSMFYNDVISEANKFFLQSNPLGILYEIDLKLRPNGRNAPVIISATQFEKYLASNDSIWEKLVYTKARVISNNLNFKRSIENTISNFVYSPIDPSILLQEVVSMRIKIAENAFKKEGYKFLFKKGYGGLIDIEFIVEFLLIKHGIHDSTLRKRNIYNVLNMLLRKNILHKHQYRILSASLDFLREIEYNLRFMNHFHLSKLPENEKDIHTLSISMGFSGEKSFLIAYKKITENVKKIYQEILQSGK